MGRDRGSPVTRVVGESCDLADRVAVIRGANSGVGAAIAGRLSALGAKLGLASRRLSAGDLELSSTLPEPASQALGVAGGFGWGARRTKNSCLVSRREGAYCGLVGGATAASVSCPQAGHGP